jgi:hypothetical protein
LPKPLDLPSRQRPWISLAVSAALHALLLALAVHLSHEPVSEPSTDQAAAPDEPQRQVEMVYLQPPPPKPTSPPPPAPKPPPPKPPPPPPPPAQKPPTPRPRAMAPPPEKAQTRPEPDANAPPEAKRAEGEEPTDVEKPPGSTSAAPEATMESEARRIFGRQHRGPAPGAGPRASRPMEAYLPDHPEKCIPQPSPPRDSAGPPEFGVVTGRIFRQDNGRALVGAHLQMLGTPYVTFTDGNGEYRFRFDLSLVDNCRTQYVRVTAAGYESRLLVLVVGSNVRSDDVALKKK